MNEIKFKIKNLMNNVFSVDLNFEELTQSNISNWDSINHLNLIIELETYFDINIDPEEIIKMNDFNSIYSILKQKIKT